MIVLAPRSSIAARANKARRWMGRAAERIAADFYEVRGFRILGMNVRLGALEIDVLARRGPLLVVVEVRTRRPGAIISAFASVNGPKRRRLHAAARRVWAKLQHDQTLERIRVDVASVDLSCTPVTIEIAEAVV